MQRRGIGRSAEWRCRCCRHHVPNRSAREDRPRCGRVDAGAEKRVWNIAKEINAHDVILASKIRNVETGKIIHTSINGDVKGKTCIIIDDIIDGGATFIYLAQLLKKNGANKVYLIVSHGIFSKGLDVLKDLDGIYTTDSIKIINEKNVKTFSINKYSIGCQLVFFTPKYWLAV